MTLTVAEPEGYVARLRAASRDDMLAMLARASETEALAAVHALSLRELYELPREIVQAWTGHVRTPGTARFVRAERLTTESWANGNISAMWRITDIARAANVRSDSVGRWRTNTNNGVRNWMSCLPVHTASIGEVKEPGERKGQKGGGGTPFWEPSTVLNWLKAARKIDDDCYPHNRARGGGIPPGRPPSPREGE